MVYKTSSVPYVLVGIWYYWSFSLDHPGGYLEVSSYGLTCTLKKITDKIE